MKFNIVVSLNNHNLIGENDDLLIRSKKDLKRFAEITTNGKVKNIVIMGYKTWLSIPESKRPLQNRFNIVLSRNHSIISNENQKCFQSLESAFEFSKELEGECFVIGGSQIFDECCKPEHIINLDKLYITRFDDNYHPRNTTHSFPLQLFENMKLIQQSAKHNEICTHPSRDASPKSYIQEYLEEKESQSVSFTFDIYQKDTNINQDELQYINLLEKIMKEGTYTESRNSKVYSLFGEKMTFDLTKGFPLITTKQVGYKTILRELLWFIRGSTSNKELQDKKVHIWTQNSSREFLDSRGLDYEEGDLGPVYGFQWRHFGSEYTDYKSDYTGKGVDQLKYIIDQIKNDPHSRRIIMSAWNPVDLDKMALPPCHVMVQFHVDVPNNKLDCQLYQRSGDMFLGVPFNIASYAFLTCIIAKITGYQPGRLIHVLGDTHIYDSHLESVKTQINRIPYQFPTLEISDRLSHIDDIQEEDFKLKNYNHHDKLTAPMIA